MKTIDEAVKEIYSYNVDEFTWISDEKRDAFITGVEFAQRWIPVEEELPENFTTVIVKDGKENPIRSLALYEDNEFYPDFLLKHNQVTHWRPIELK